MSQKESDPRGLAANEPGAKLDEGKAQLRYLLYFPRALEAICNLSAYGAKKYSPGGWRYVDDGVNRYTDAMDRHHLQEGLKYSEHDIDSGFPHIVQTAWNALARLELYLCDADVEDPTRSDRFLRQSLDRKCEEIQRKR